jgi:hypothetical protein
MKANTKKNIMNFLKGALAIIAVIIIGTKGKKG